NTLNHSCLFLSGGILGGLLVRGFIFLFASIVASSFCELSGVANVVFQQQQQQQQQQRQIDAGQAAQEMAGKMAERLSRRLPKQLSNLKTKQTSQQSTEQSAPQARQQATPQGKSLNGDSAQASVEPPQGSQQKDPREQGERTQNRFPDDKPLGAAGP